MHEAQTDLAKNPDISNPDISRNRISKRIKRRILGLAATALALPLTAGLISGSVATAAPARTAPAGGYEEVFVDSSMGPIKVQIQWASRGGNAALYLLDGLRARDDRNAWSFETNALEQYRGDNVTLVMPVGGQSSFYSDWYANSNLNRQPVTYKWETFLTQELPAYLESRGVSRTNNGVLGLSMGGSAALTLAAYHRDQFKFAGSLSGYLNISAPGMREAIRVGHGQRRVLQCRCNVGTAVEPRLAPQRSLRVCTRTGWALAVHIRRERPTRPVRSTASTRRLREYR